MDQREAESTLGTSDQFEKTLLYTKYEYPKPWLQKGKSCYERWPEDSPAFAPKVVTGSTSVERPLPWLPGK